LASACIGRPVFVHVRMAVQLKKDKRPPWFLDARRSGGLFLDLLIHGLDQVEWITGDRIVALTARMGNLGNAEDPRILDHASVFCELAGGGSAVVEGQRMLPDSKGSDYRVLAVGTTGYADLDLAAVSLTCTDRSGAARPVAVPAAGLSVVSDWLDRGELVPQADSLRANRLALLATLSSERRRRLDVEAETGRQW
jgi:predicted dehydrogenase